MSGVGVGVSKEWRQDRERLAELPGWEERPCRPIDTASFYDKAAGAELAAVQVCRCGCPVLRACGEYALRWERFGVWGGMTEQQRREVRAALRRRDQSDPAQLEETAAELYEVGFEAMGRLAGPVALAGAGERW